MLNSRRTRVRYSQVLGGTRHCGSETSRRVRSVSRRTRVRYSQPPVRGRSCGGEWSLTREKKADTTGHDRTRREIRVADALELTSTALGLTGKVDCLRRRD